MEYSRDKRSPKPKNKNTSIVMSANKAKSTNPEVLLRKKLYEKGIRGYRIHNKKLPGRPDVAFIGKKIAIFVNGCYWHRCPKCDLPLPKHNQDFWKNKFQKNVERDLRKNQELINDGWKVLTIWECEIKKDLDNCITRVKECIDE